MNGFILLMGESLSGGRRWGKGRIFNTGRFRWQEIVLYDTVTLIIIDVK